MPGGRAGAGGRAAGIAGNPSALLSLRRFKRPIYLYGYRDDQTCALLGTKHRADGNADRHGWLGRPPRTFPVLCSRIPDRPPPRASFPALHYNTHPQALSKQLGLQPKSLGSRYQRARETVQKALHAADAGASSAYLLYWYNLGPERIAVLRELLEKQWQFHDYTSLQEPQRTICRLMDSLHLRPAHRGHAYMVYALSLSLENPSLLQSGEVWQKTAAHYQTPVNKITSTLSSFVQSIRATGALTKLIGISSGYARHYAKLAAAMYWHLTGRRLTFCYHLSSTFMEEDIQILKDLYAHPMPIAHYAKANGYDPPRLQHRITSLGGTLLALYNDMRHAPDLYLLYWYGLTEEQLPFLKKLAIQYAAFHTRSLGRFLYKRR